MDLGILNPNSYTLAIQYFLHLLGAVYFFAFSAFIFQLRGLIGLDGILPLKSYLKRMHKKLNFKALYYVPSLFWFDSNDRTLLLVPLIGSILGLLLLGGGPPFILLPILIVLHLSIVSVGQDFLGFGWEGFLLEISYNAFFLSLTTEPNILIWISINLLLFRFHFEAGTSKIESHDENWKNLTAIKYHYQSQPLPNTVAWYMYKLPLSFHKISTFLMFVIELVIPFIALFGNAELRLFAFICMFGLQASIAATGNLSYLNLMTATLLIILLANHFLPIIPLFSFEWAFSPNPFLNFFISLAGIVLIFLQLMALLNHYFPTLSTRKLFYKIYHLHLANRYGIFAVMTTERYEIVIEGSEDGKEWKEYLFKFKPSETNRRPRQNAPFQFRIDWQAWFLPLGQSYEDQVWLKNLLIHLLQNSPHVVSLFRFNPFKEKPPRYIRCAMYLYEFTDLKTKNETGQWWKRTFIDFYSPILYRN